MIFVSSANTREVFTWTSAIDAILDAYSAETDERASPGRVVAVAGDRSMRCMPAIPPSGRYMGTKHLVKTSGGFRYAITLFDQDDSDLAYLVDGLHVTAFRTAATSAAALMLMSADEPVDLAVLGSSVEARNHVAAIASIRSIHSLRVYSPSPDSRRAFGEWVRKELDIEAIATTSGQDAVVGADCVVAAARSRGELPILFGEWLDSAQTVISIGSTLPTQRELDVSVLERASLIVSDEPHELLHETGDLIEVTAAGIDVTSKLFSLRDLARGDLKTRLSTGTGMRLFKSVGSGLQDIVVAEVIALQCTRAGLGTELPVSLSLR